MTRWMWVAVVLASGCVIVEDDDKEETGDTGDVGDDDDDDTDPPDPDDDGDGVTVGDGDCDDANAAINPNALEICDTIDNNCDTLIDDAAAVTIGAVNYATVDEAIAAAVTADTLSVCAGTWTAATIEVGNGLALTLTAVSGRDVTSLAETAGGPVASLTGDGTLSLSGFTVSGSVGSAFVLADGATLNLLDSRVTANARAIELVGDPGVTVSVEGSTIDANDAGNEDGGAILAVGDFNITLTDSALNGNSAATGGAIYGISTFAAVGVISLVETTIEGNNASIGGGLALFNVPLSGDGASTITLNTADTAGGGVALYKSSLDAVLVSTNDAPQGGGVAALYDQQFITAPIDNILTGVIIDSNTADLGAGIWVDEDEPFSLDATSSVTLNVAATDGGGAYLDGTDSSLTSSGGDFGTPEVNDNAPNDIVTGAGPFDFIAGEVFSCTGGAGCQAIVP